jgi:hypothetical protein
VEYFFCISAPSPGRIIDMSGPCARCRASFRDVWCVTRADASFGCLLCGRFRVQERSRGEGSAAKRANEGTNEHTPSAQKHTNTHTHTHTQTETHKHGKKRSHPAGTDDTRARLPTTPPRLERRSVRMATREGFLLCRCGALQLRSVQINDEGFDDGAPPRLAVECQTCKHYAHAGERARRGTRARRGAESRRGADAHRLCRRVSA